MCLFFYLQNKIINVNSVSYNLWNHRCLSKKRKKWALGILNNARRGSLLLRSVSTDLPNINCCQQMGNFAKRIHVYFYLNNFSQSILISCGDRVKRSIFHYYKQFAYPNYKKNKPFFRRKIFFLQYSLIKLCPWNI